MCVSLFVSASTMFVFSKQNTNAHVDAHMHTDVLMYTVELTKEVLSARDAELNKDCQLPKLRGINVAKRACHGDGETLSERFEVMMSTGAAS